MRAARSLGRPTPRRQAHPGENRSSLYQIAARREGEAELLLARQVALEDSGPCAQEFLERLVRAGAEVRAQRMTVDTGVLDHEVIALAHQRHDVLQLPEHVRAPMIGVQ